MLRSSELALCFMRARTLSSHREKPSAMDIEAGWSLEIQICRYCCIVPQLITAMNDLCSILDIQDSDGPSCIAGLLQIDSRFAGTDDGDQHPLAIVSFLLW